MLDDLKSAAEACELSANHGKVTRQCKALSTAPSTAAFCLFTQNEMTL